MEDERIIALYFARDEAAIGESDKKYGSLCRRLARNILTLWEDAEECVNDTWLAAWQTMPPQRPRVLGAFLGRITRNISISLYRKNRAGKRYSGMDVLLSELEDCLPAAGSTEEAAEGRALSQWLSLWLDSLDPEDRVWFIRRYWYGEAVKDLAAQAGRTPNQMAQTMRKLRLRLRAFLEEKGVQVS